MRKLNAKQKTYLTELSKKGIRWVEDMSGEEYATLESMGDFEILYQETNRFLGDIQK